MPKSTAFLTGVIEGFYGRVWSRETRLAYADYLGEAGLNTYIYCPKGDPYLRRLWQSDWPSTQWHELLELASACRNRGILWGVGLSPVELYRDYGPSQKLQLQQKVARLGELEAPVLAILFDDMPGDMEALASRQCEIVADVHHWAPGVRLLVCPTYYSFDPVLEQYFGLRPANYWTQLGAELPVDVEIFWTGNKVCSNAIDVSDVNAIVQQLGRPVVLWDNYPVNDGEKRSHFLYTTELSNRSAALRYLTRGHMCNPMNQGVLSLPALSGLAKLYGNEEFAEGALARILGPLTWERLALDKVAFEQQGLAGMGDERCKQLALVYGNLPGAAAQEIAQWLRGDYTFDPACLTG